MFGKHKITNVCDKSGNFIAILQYCEVELIFK